MSALPVLWDAGRTTSAMLLAVGGPGLILWWLRDRRKDRAAGAVAERTVGADVDVKETGRLEARLVYAVKAFDAERASYDRRIDDLEEQGQRKDADLAHRDELIATLRREVEELRDRLADATRQLASVLARLDELTESDAREGQHVQREKG